MASKPGGATAAVSRGRDDGGARLEALTMDKVAEAADAVAAAASVGEVVRAIHAVAVLLFPVDSAAVAGTVDEPFRSQHKLGRGTRDKVQQFMAITGASEKVALQALKASDWHLEGAFDYFYS